MSDINACSSFIRHSRIHRACGTRIIASGAVDNGKSRAASSAGRRNRHRGHRVRPAKTALGSTSVVLPPPSDRPKAARSMLRFEIGSFRFCPEPNARSTRNGRRHGVETRPSSAQFQFAGPRQFRSLPQICSGGGVGLKPMSSVKRPPWPSLTKCLDRRPRAVDIDSWP